LTSKKESWSVAETEIVGMWLRIFHFAFVAPNMDFIATCTKGASLGLNKEKFSSPIRRNSRYVYNDFRKEFTDIHAYIFGLEFWKALN